MYPFDVFNVSPAGKDGLTLYANVPYPPEPLTGLNVVTNTF